MCEKKIKFISVIWGYHQQLFSLSSVGNYHLHALKVAKNMGYQPVAFLLDNTVKIEDDPNFDTTIQVVYYSDIFSYLYFLWFNRKSVFYANTLVWKSIIVGLFAKKTIFMSHDSVARKKRIKQYLQNLFFRFFSKIRVISEGEKQFLINCGIAAEKIFVVPLAIDVNNFSYFEKIERKNLVFLGNVTPDKNITDILCALDIINKSGIKIKLEIVGEIRDKVFNFLVQKLKLNEHIILHGFIGHSDLNNFLNKTLIYVNSSISEGQCLAAYEAALTGNVLCLPKILSFNKVFDGKALFHDLYDCEGLANNIIKYIKNGDLLDLYRQKARQFVVNNYNELIITNKLETVFTFF